MKDPIFTHTHTHTHETCVMKIPVEAAYTRTQSINRYIDTVPEVEDL